MNDHVLQQFQSHYWLICPNCGEETQGEVIVPEPAWGEAEQFGDLHSEGETELQCENCDAVFSCHVIFTYGSCTGNLLEFPDTNLTLDEPRFWPPEEWSFVEPATHPYQVFQDSLLEIRDIALAADDESGGSMLNRMCFSQLWSALEAYLSDTLINAARGDFEKQLSVVNTDSQLKARKFTLQEIGQSEGFVWKAVSEHLRDLVYHNIGRIDPLYQVVFGMPVVKDAERRAELHKLVADRHDCVHRNGRTKDGHPPDKYTVQFVLKAANLFSVIVDEIEVAANPPGLDEEFV